jgi:DNA polymerase III sliding clamp (beta) subunit (PCNA family)
MKKEISRKTLELILKTFESVSKDETRLNLNGVRLGFDADGNSIVEATNGHILARHNITENFKDEIVESLIIDRAGQSKLKSFLSSHKYENTFLVDLDVENNRHLKILEKNERDGIILPIIERDYPNTNAVIPKIKEEECIEVAFNPSLLMKLYKSLNGEKRGERVLLKINKNNSLSPIIVESGKNNLGVLMPIKM